MTLVAGQLHLIVLHNILLDNCVAAVTFELRLLHSLSVKVALWDKARVSGEVSRHLSGALSQVVSRVRLLLRIVGKPVAWVVTVGAVTNIELRLHEGAVRRVCLTRQAPHGWAALDVFRPSLGLDFGLVSRLKVTG